MSLSFYQVDPVVVLHWLRDHGYITPAQADEAIKHHRLARLRAQRAKRP